MYGRRVRLFIILTRVVRFPAGGWGGIERKTTRRVGAFGGGAGGVFFFRDRQDGNETKPVLRVVVVYNIYVGVGCAERAFCFSCRR